MSERKRIRLSKRQVYAERAARLNEKRRKKAQSQSEEPGPSPLASTLPDRPEPSLQGPFEPVQVIEAVSENGGESESENERQESLDSDSDGDFDDDAAQNCFDDFMVSLPSLTRKTLSVSLIHYFNKRSGMTIKDSAQEAAYITGFNEKTIRLPP